jgi:hypothetical protein
MCALQPVARDRGHLSLLTFIHAESRAHSRVFHMDGKQARRRGIPGPRRYSENLPHGPLPPFA